MNMGMVGRAACQVDILPRFSQRWRGVEWALHRACNVVFTAGDKACLVHRSGCVSALTRSSCCAGILEACGGGLDAALQQYNTERLPDVQALLTLNQMWSARLGTNQEVCHPAGGSEFRC